MTSYEVAERRIAYDGALSRVRVDHVRMPDGDVAEREIVEHPDAVAVVALDDDDRVLLLRQYRHAVGERLLELPAGKLDEAGESPRDAAERELQEEAHVRAGRVTVLTRFHNSAGWTDEQTTVFLAEDVHDVGAPDGFTARHEEADMELLWVPLDEAVELVRTGGIGDAKTVIGLLALVDRRAAGGR